MRFRTVICMAFIAVCSMAATAAVVTTAPAAPPPGKGGKPPKPTPTPSPTATPTPAPVNPADADFVGMMIPHHHQALLMSRMAPSKSSDQAVRAIAAQIDAEQGLEITTMQAWQGWHGLPATNAAEAYEEMVQDPMMVEMMGMASPEQMAALSASTGAAFDVLFLRLMIRHHQGAIDMCTDILANGSDEILRQWATEMQVTQQAQINWMQDLLADKT
jgi:uncharacterized protein (DUF305 family)